MSSVQAVQVKHVIHNHIHIYFKEMLINIGSLHCNKNHLYPTFTSPREGVVGDTDSEILYKWRSHNELYKGLSREIVLSVITIKVL